MKIKENRKIQSESILDVISKFSDKSSNSKNCEMRLWDKTESFKGNTKEAIMNDIDKS
jgi:hypothetical protein